MFSKDEHVQLLHVTRDLDEKGLSVVQSINTRLSHTKVFDDLEARASDLLQSNCVVWVEGPSDRIYFNKWIELFDPELHEHDDYEIAFTGGTLLSHLTYDDPIEPEKIEALRINRNAIILMDRDFPETQTGLKERVERVSSEIEGNEGIAWITEGREVENYIPVEALRLFLENSDLNEPELSEDIFILIKDMGMGDYTKRKPLLAERICRLLSRQMLERCLDLEPKITEVCRLIRKWNSRPAQPANSRTAP